MPSIGETLSRNARRVPDREALVFKDRRLTYAEFDREVNRTANAMARKGLGKGDRVILMSPNTDLFITVFYASMKLGAVAVPINPGLAPPEVSYILEDSGAKALVFAPALAETAKNGRQAITDGSNVLLLSTEPLDGYEDIRSLGLRESEEAPGVKISESDDAEILYTSGTTGKPKGVLLDHHRVIWVAMGLITTCGLKEKERVLHVAPLYHSAELNLCMVTATYLGATHVVLPDFQPEVVADTLQEERVTVFLGVPTMYQFLLRQPDLGARDFSAWRLGLFGAAPMPASTAATLTEAFPSVQFYSLCGLTEMGPGGICLDPQEVRERPGASGRQAILNTEVRVVDDEGEGVSPGEVGELVLRGETMMKEYWNKPQETADTIRYGWLYTGDLASVDDEGFITLVDRMKDMIITGGRNVYSVEVENALASHPDVLDCAVVAAPHETYGESVVAVVTAREGTEITLEDIREHCRPLIADYKLPHRLSLSPIPRNPSGKVLKRELRRTLEEDATGEPEQGVGW